MLNQTIVVGRIVSEPELKETENGKKVTNLTIAVQRQFQNANGEYDTDFLDCVLWNGVAENTVNYCQKGDLIGIKGRLGSTYNDKGQHIMELVAERVTFLSSKKNIDDNVDMGNLEENISI